MAIPRRSAPALVGDCEVQVEVADPIAIWGETISGLLRLRAGATQRIHVARVGLVHCRSGGGDQHRQYVRTEQLQKVQWVEFDVGWQAALLLPFRLDVPYGLPLHGDVMIRGSVALNARGVAVVAVNVVTAPPFYYTTVASCLAELSGCERTGWRQVRGTECLLQFRAPSGHPLGKGLTLRLSQSGDQLTGDVTVNAANPIRWLGRSPSAAGFRFSCPVANLETLRADFERGLRSLEKGVRSLPLPADPPAIRPETLPLPAGEGEDGL